jgi:hypothetical protein
MKNDEPQGILDLWPVMVDDFKKFMSDRPGWLIDAMENAREKGGEEGWGDIEKLVAILRFLKDTEIEYD